MLKKIVCSVLWLAVISACALQTLCRKAAGKDSSSMSSHDTQERTASFNQAPAPFGKYTENINGVLLELVRIPTGTFLMGNDKMPNPEEKPVHRVNIISLFMGQYEVTRQQWNVVVDLPRINRTLTKQYVGPVFGGILEETTPAEEIFWNDAVEFCERLSRFTGKKYRLPSEAEWEYACRAGTTTEFSWGDQFNLSFAHLDNEPPRGIPIPVGKKGYANAWGLYDMHGNVAEMCQDYTHPNYTGAPTDGSAWIQSGNQNERILRGGMYGFRSDTGRSSARYFLPTPLRASGFGFRVAAEISPLIGNGNVTATSAASYLGTDLATESIAALFGNNLAIETRNAVATPLPVTLAGTSVTVRDSRGNEHLAPLFFASPNQVNLQVPPDVALGMAIFNVVKNGAIHSTGATEIANLSPGLFAVDSSGAGLAAAVVLRIKSDGQQTYEPIVQFDTTSKRFIAVPISLDNPGDQVFLLLFGTGFRHYGALANASAKIGDVNTEVQFIGAQDGFAGLDQCNLRLLQSLAGRGLVDIVLTVSGKTSNAVNASIK